MININWIPLLGSFDVKESEEIVFKGGETEFKDNQGNSFTGPQFGRCMSNQYFVEGSVSAEIKFSEINPHSTCQVILGFDTFTDEMTLVGFGAGIISVESYSEKKWHLHTSAGDKNNLKPNVKYDLKVLVEGSRLTVFVDGVNLLSYTLPYTLQKSQIGFWCRDTKDLIYQILE